MTPGLMRHAVLFATYASLSTPAYAYLDGATGSILIQAVIGGVTTWLVYSRALGAKVKAFFRRRKDE
jgi:hypothetical protein